MDSRAQAASRRLVAVGTALGVAVDTREPLSRRRAASPLVVLVR